MCGSPARAALVPPDAGRAEAEPAGIGRRPVPLLLRAAEGAEAHEPGQESLPVGRFGRSDR